MRDLSTLRGMLEALPRFGDRPAIVTLRNDQLETLSFRALADRVAQLARGLIYAGLEKGECAALLAKNSPEWILSALAVIQAGGAAAPIDAQLGAAALEHAVRDSGARFVFTTADELPKVEEVCRAMEARWVLLDAEPNDARSWQSLAGRAGAAIPRLEANDVAALFYTSGTTGSAKGVPLSHRNLAFQIETVASTRLVSSADRVLLPLPLHHVYPFVIGMLVPLAMGLPLILPESLTGPGVVRAIREGGATAVIGVPRLYSALCAGLEARVEAGSRAGARLFHAAYRVSLWLRRRFGWRAGKLLLRPLHREFGPRLRLMASGGAALAPDLAWKLEALGWQVAVGYGLTETSPLLTLNLPGKGRIGSAGEPIPGVALRIDSAALPAGEADGPGAAGGSGRGVGEVLARGPNVFSGYRNLPEKTAEAFTQDGWFRTGDIGFLDAKNFLHLTGRLSALIVSEGGENIQPDDVEEAYLRHPAISEIGVLQKDGKLTALIVPKLSRNVAAGGKDGIERGVRDAVSAVSRRLPSYQRVSEFVLTRDPLPRTRLGKIRRHLLASYYDRAKAAREEEAPPRPMLPEEMTEEDRAALEDPAAKATWELLARRFHDRRLAPGASPQLDLGMDSLEWLNLSMEIRQRAGVELSEEAVSRIDTVRDLLREVRSAGAAASKASWLEEPEAAISPQRRRWLRPQGLAVRLAAGALYALVWALARILFRLRVKGLEHLPEHEPFVLIPNHLSYLDPGVLAAAIGRRRMRQTYWGGWTGVMTTNPFNRMFSRCARVIPIDPDRALFSSLAFGAAVLKRGKNLVWFPEGGLPADGQLQAFKPGVGILLDHFQTLAVPVAIRGTNRALPPGRLVPKLRRVTVEFGPPLRPGEWRRLHADGGDPGRIVAALRERIAAMQRAAGDDNS